MEAGDGATAADPATLARLQRLSGDLASGNRPVPDNTHVGLLISERLVRRVEKNTDRPQPDNPGRAPLA